MRRISTETPLELVEMFITLFSIFKDSTAISSVLMDDFRSCQGYLFLQDYLLQLGEMDDHSVDEASRSMVICVSNFTMVGYTPLRPSRSIGAPFQDSDFRMPQATENGTTELYYCQFQVTFQLAVPKFVANLPIMFPSLENWARTLQRSLQVHFNV
jgi:hypothetical protein